MTPTEKRLLNIINKEVLPEIEEYIDELFAKIASKNYLDSDEAALYEAKELRDEFKDMVQEIESGEMSEEECLEIIDEINEMKEFD